MNIKFTKPEASHLRAEGFKEPRPMVQKTHLQQQQATFGYPHFETNPKVIISPPLIPDLADISPPKGICDDC